MKKITFLIGLVAVLIGYLWAQPLLAQAPERRSRPEREALDASTGWAYLPHDQHGMQQDAPATPTVPNTWSKIVYQHYSGGWDIYLMNGDGSNPTRLTSTGEADITPRLNRGATRIAYVSKEPGNYEIYAVNPDGTGRARLTNNSANDYNPSWSPDGSKIAFNSYRDGQSEVYVMNANGTNPVRVTSHAAYDGQPVWSPDGNKIAFLSDRSEGGRIWVMNADGSGAAQLTTQPYSEDPAWSPDGSQVAYDADVDSDGWQELIVVNADGSNAHVIGDLNTTADMWARGWSPDGRKVTFTEINYVSYQGNWYWTAAYLRAADVSTYGIDALGGAAVDWYPDWQSTDLLPPTSGMTALPATSPSPFVVRWSGTDVGASGIQGYDVQVKDGADAWTGWLTRTLATSASYSGLGGHTYSFRVRAVDNSSNFQAWPAAAQASSIVEALPPVTAVSSLPAYQRGDLSVSWSGSDPGGSGIKSYDVQYQDGTAGIWADWLVGTISNSANFNGTAGHTYYFRARAIDQAQNLGIWSDAGGLPSTTFYLWQITGEVRDVRGKRVVDASIVLSPTALNILTTSVSGYRSYVPASDKYSASVYQSGFGSAPPMSLTIASDVIANHWLPPLDNAIQNGGFEAPVWPESWLTFGNPQPLLDNASPHSGQASIRLGRATGPIDPQVIMSGQGYHTVVDQQGTIHVVGLTDFYTPDYLYATKRLTATSFTTPTFITFNVPGMMGKALKFVPDDNGGLYGFVTRSENNQKYLAACHKLAVETVCGNFRNLIAIDTDDYVSSLSVVMDQYGGWHLAWTPSSVFYAYVRYGYVAPGGSLGSVVTFTVGEPGNLISGVSLTMDPAMGLHLAWSRDYYVPGAWYADIMYSTRPFSGAWSTPVRIALSQDVYGVDLISGDDGTLHLAYASQTHGVYYSFKLRNQNWTTPEYVLDSDNAFSSVLRIDRLGRPHVAVQAGPVIRYVMLGSGHVWRHLFDVGAPDSSSLQAQLDPTGLMYIFWQPTSVTPPFALSYTRPDLALADSDVGLTQTVTVSAASRLPSLSLLYKPADQFETDNTLSVSFDDGIARSTVLTITPGALGWSHAWADLSAWQGKTISLTVNWHQSMGKPYSAIDLDEVLLGSWLTPDPQGVTPEQIEAIASTVITITGDNFIAPAQVRLGDTLLPDTYWVNTNTITATVPILPPDHYDVIVINPGGQASGLSKALLIGREVFLPLMRK
jgi:hypothetical protein